MFRTVIGIFVVGASVGIFVVGASVGLIEIGALVGNIVDEPVGEAVN